MALVKAMAAVRRGWWAIALSGLIGIAASLVYIATRTDSYTATSSISTEQRRVRLIQDAYTFSGEEGSYESDLGTPVELIRSSKIASIVAEMQGLAPRKLASAAPSEIKNPDQPEPTLKRALEAAGLDRLADRLYPKRSYMDDFDRVVLDLRSSVFVRRLPRTAILEISFSSGDAAYSARMANAFAEAYIEYNRRLQREASSSTAAWLKDRLAELRDAVNETEQSIEKFKGERGFVAAEGRLLDEQRLIEASRQLAAAQSEASNARVRFAKLQSMVNAPATAPVALEFLNDPLIGQLRARHLQVDISERNLSAKLGSRHNAVERLRQQKSEIDKQLRLELERIASSLRGQIELAQARQEAIQIQYKQLADLQAESNEAQIELRELQRRNDAYKTLYTSVLQKYQSAINQQSLNENPARVISRATPPDSVNGPGAGRILAFGLVMGAGLGAAGLAFGALFDRTMRTRAEVLGSLPVPSAWLLPPADPHHRKLAVADDTPKALLASGEFVHAQRNPSSFFGGTIDAIRLAVGDAPPQEGGRILGIVSIDDGERSSLVAKSLASMIALTGARTVLVDADLGMAKLTQAIASGSKAGLAAVAVNMIRIDDVVLVEQDTGLKMVPAVKGETSRRPSDLWTSTAMRDLFACLSAEHDYVILALPPLASGADAEASLAIVRQVVMTATWGETTADSMMDVFGHTRSLADKCVGVVLAGADLSAARTFGETDARAYGRRSARGRQRAA